MILLLKFACNTQLGPKMKNLAANLAKSANYASSAFFRNIGENYMCYLSKPTEGGTIFQASGRVLN